MREEAWHAIRSTLTHTRGPVRIIGNVRGRKNWFYRLCRLAESGVEGMAYHKIIAWDAVEAGILDRAEIESARRDFTRLGQEGLFRQLYLAEASDTSDNPFGGAAIRACLDGEITDVAKDGSFSWQAPGEHRPLAGGADLAGRGAVNLTSSGEATARDFTAVCLLDKDGRVVSLEQFRLPNAETTEAVAQRLKGVLSLVDSTGSGDAVVEALQRRGDQRVLGFVFNERTRQDLLEGLAMAIGDGAVRFPDGPLRDQLDSFEIRYSTRGVRWAAPESSHDDAVMALALAVKRMPWRRKRALAPSGVKAPGGSRWTGLGSESDAWRKYQEGLKPTAVGMADQEVAVPVAAPTLVVGGGNKWSAAG